MANNLSEVIVDNVKNSGGKNLRTDRIQLDIDAIARANNVSVDKVAYLEIGNSINGVKYLYSSTDEKFYYSPLELTGNIDSVSSEIEGTITIEVDGVSFKILLVSPYFGKYSFFYYDDISKSSDNYDLLISAVNNGFSVNFVSDIYIAPSGSITSKSPIISSSNGARINWVGSGTVFKFKDGLSLIDENCNHIVESGESVVYVDYENNDGILDSVSMKNFSIDGTFRLISLSTGLNLDPEVNSFGIKKVIAKDGEIKNQKDSLILLNSTPYDLVDVSGIVCKNKKSMVVSLPVQNFHPYYLNVQKSMKQAFIRNITYKNDRGVFVDDAESFYSGIVLHEGNKITVENTHCENIVSSNNAKSIYDVYMAGLHSSINNNVMIDCWVFGAETNTGVKLKKSKNCNVDKKRFTFSDDFFSYHENNHSLLLSGSAGNPFTIDLEGDTQGENYSISNSHIVIPLAPSDSTNKAKQDIINFKLINSYIEVKDGGSAYMLVPRWTAEMPDVAKSIIVKGNTIVTNTTGAYYLVDMNINNGTPDGGVIDISDNSITANQGGLYELLLSSDDTAALSTVLDTLNIDNTVYSEGFYEQFKQFNKTPGFKSVHFGEKLTANTSNRPEINSSIVGEGIMIGSYEVSNKNANKDVGALMFSRPQSGKVGNCTALLAGFVIDSNGRKDFHCEIIIEPDEGLNTIDFTFDVIGAGTTTVTWSGSSVNDTVVNIGYDSTEPFQLKLRRFSDFAKFIFEYKSGESPAKSLLNWNVAIS